MKTFASALLASSALGAATYIDYKIKGSYIMTQDKTVNYDFMYSSSDNGTNDTPLASTNSYTTIRYGRIQYDLELSSNLVSRTITNTCTMVMTGVTLSSISGSGTSATNNVSIEQFACYKNGLTAAGQKADKMGLSCWAVGFHKPTVDGAAKYNITVYNYQAASDSRATEVGDYSTSDASNTDAAASGLEKTGAGFAGSTWTKKQLETKDNVLLTSAQDITAYDSVNAGDGEIVFTDNASAKPRIVTTYAGSVAGITSTFVRTTAAAGTYFQTNGPIWSGQMRSFDQANAVMMFGFKYGILMNKVLKEVKFAKLTLDSTSKPTAERWTMKDDQTTQAANLVSTTVGLATGVTSAKNTLDLFAWDDEATEGQITVRVKQTSVLTTAVTNVASKAHVQQLTCLAFYSASDSQTQYLCFLADTTIHGDNATTANGTSTIKHTVWQAGVKPTITMYSKSTGTDGKNDEEFDSTSTATNLKDASQKGFIVFEGSSPGSGDAGANVYGQEATFTDTMPNGKFMHMHGNYVAKDRKTVTTTFGFSGNAQVIGNAANKAGSLARVGLDTGTIKTIKDAAGTYGIAGTYLRIGSGTKSSTTIVSAAYAAPTTTTCDTNGSTLAQCKAKHPSLNGALSTIASVGAAIAALAMVF